jgi:hypothetical protein
MTVRIKKGPSALKHAGYSATSILPGESEAEFSKLHADLVREWTPNGVLEDEIVASHGAPRVAQEKTRNVSSCEACPAADDRNPNCDGAGDGCAGVRFPEKWHAAESQARNELGELYALVEMGEEATLDHLMKQLEVQDRLDAAIDRCIKRLLLVRGVKSMSIGSTSAPPQSLPSPSKAA